MAEKSTKKAGDKAEASSAASKKKPEKKKKDGLIAKVSRFAKELRSEIKKNRLADQEAGIQQYLCRRCRHGQRRRLYLDHRLGLRVPAGAGPRILIKRP